MGTLDSPHQPTFYDYNIKGELVKVTQGNPNQVGQTIQRRYFMYDSLGRLIRVRQPEQTPNATLNTTGNPDNNQWTAGYSYDIVGNVLTVTDANNIVITNSYDKAGRVKTRSYANETGGYTTPTVDYYYDGKGLATQQSPNFAKGALTKTSSSISENLYTEFDNFGRLKKSQQVTDGNTYEFLYNYNFSGALVEETYPSGRVVRNFLDSDGGLAAVSSKAANGQMKTVATNFDYSATGDVRKMMLGNGLWETAQFSERLQLTQIGLGTSTTNNNQFKIDYEYGELNTDGTTVDQAKNIGNIAKQTTTIPTTSFVQTYKYDSLNRLTEAKEKTGSTQNWKQTFGYDKFGNRTSFTQEGNNLPANPQPTIDPTNNQFTTGQGYVYDYQGNLIQDAQGRSFKFNGDDKQREVRNTSNNQLIGEYFYDGDGARVKKVVGGVATIFVYDAAGDLAAEYSSQTPTQQYSTTSYLTYDHLGSPRVITDRQGQVTSRRDFMPFGEELGVGVGGRSESLKYSVTNADNIRQRFTGYEKDTETDLDFAQARMYQNRHGRFTAVDPLMASASATNPQSFNRYIYTSNNPVNSIDPSGLSWCRAANGDTRFAGRGVTCSSEEENIDGQTRSITRGSFPTDRGGTVGVGAEVIFNASGTVTVVHLNNTVQETVEVTGGGQSGIVDVSSTTIETEITLQEVPCDAGYQCSGGKILNPTVAENLTAPIAPTESGSSETLINIAGVCGFFFEPCDIYGGLLSLNNGDYKGAGLSAGALFPVGGIVPGIIKLGRKADNVVDGVSDTTKLRSVSSYNPNATTGGSVRNTSTDASPLSAAKALKENGFSKSRSRSGGGSGALNFSKGNVKYSLRMKSSQKSGGGPTLDRYKNGKIKLKIRLNK